MSPSSPERPVVQYVRLGKSGLRVSVPIFGTMSIGSSKTQVRTIILYFNLNAHIWFNASPSAVDH